LTTAPDIELNPSDLESFYTKYFNYYSRLDDTYKALFIKRCLQFLSEKEISGAGAFNPDNRVKALITASAVQLTLGLETWNLAYFEEIELHASDFDSTKGGQKFSGETNLQGYIKLSWKSFVRGYQVEDDGINLGLHEFSHALRFNGIKGNAQDYFIDNYFNKWLACAYDAFRDIQNKRDTIFRTYGGANINEFLSVCIEHYFESPEEIKEKYPLLYYATGILLNQYTVNGRTKLEIRNEFLAEQNKHLPGLETIELQSDFVKHWTFKLWIFVFITAIYTATTSGISNPITLALSLMFISIFLWYHYNSVKMKFEGKEVLLEKGSLFFKNRKHTKLLISEIISFKRDSEEWSFRYYNKNDLYFYEEKIHPQKGVSDWFIADCKRNKIAGPA